MAIEYKFEGEVFYLHDSKGCYTEVVHKGVTGWVGVSLDENNAQKYRWNADNQGSVATDGIRFGSSEGSDFLSNLHALCRNLRVKSERRAARSGWDPKTGCEEMHEMVKQLGEKS